MKPNLQITFRGMSPSQALSEYIRDSAEKLELFFNGITGCHVVVEEPHRHHQQGNHFHVRLDLHVPGKNIVVARDHGGMVSHEDAYQAVSDAFDAAQRQLQHYAEELRAHR